MNIIIMFYYLVHDARESNGERDGAGSGEGGNQQGEGLGGRPWPSSQEGWVGQVKDSRGLAGI